MSLNIIIDADVASASSKISKFSYEVKKSFASIQTTLNKTADGFAYGSDNITKSISATAKDSRIALTNLSLVLQDLPYGFIGIQNNLPFLVKSFTDLSAKSKGTIEIFKSLASSLIGPAGLFLAFSAVTSAVTYAIQEYGSLGNAYDALISKNSALTKRQIDFNKELAASGGKIAGESEKIRILIGTLNDLNLSNEKRLAAYVGLKEISPDIVAGITKENALTQEGITTINDLVKARLNYLQVRARETAILNQLNKIEEDRLINEQEYTRLFDERNLKQKAYNATNKKLYDGTANFGALLQNQELAALANVNSALRDNRNKRLELYKASNDLLNQLKPLIDGTSEYESKVQTLNDKLKESIKQEKELNKVRKKEKAPFDLDEFLMDWTPPSLKDWVAEQVKEYEKFIKGIRDRNAKGAKELEKFRLDVLAKRADITVKPVPNYSNEIQQIIAENEKLKQSFLETRNFLSATFFNPMEELFTNFFKTGKFAFKSFGDAILTEIQRIVSRIITSSIIQLLANLLVVGSGAPTAVPFDFKKIVSEALGGRNLGRPRNEAFLQGGFNFGGQVSMVLRGSDLVGAMNRTNTTINRVG